MTIKPIGASAKSLKRQAKKFQKEFGITYHSGLDRSAIEAGFNNWKHFLKSGSERVIALPVLLRPEIPVPAVLKCSDTFMGNIIGERPNRKMPVNQHAALGAILQEILNLTRYHKRANKPVNDILLNMDRWMGYEYSENELPNEPFNKIYLGNRKLYLEPIPTKRQQLRLKRQLRKAKLILNKNYHDCRPLTKLYERFDLAFKALDKWPTSIKVPYTKEKIKQLPAGTFVKKRGSKKLILVFYHNTRQQIVEAYSDAGYFVAGRHEVSVVTEQIALSEYKPLRLYIPYGKWECRDGIEVLFNRDGCPMWVKNKAGEVSSADPKTDFRKEVSEYYFDDRTAPYYYGNTKYLKACKAILKDWGVEGLLPELFNLIPEAIAASDVGMLSPKGFS